MAHLERSERAGRQGHWRRKQHRWNGADHFHNDNRAPVYQQYDGVGGPGSFKGPPRSLPTVGRQDDHSGLLDELTLKHMAQDCGSLKNQLLRLKTLLQLEDTGLPADAAEESEDNTAALQLEELMKEVRVLKDELRSRDKTIAQLTLQCKQLQKQQQQQEQAGRQGRCQCHHQRAPSSLRPGERPMDRRTHYDKATQTHWRGPSQPQILQPSSTCLTEHLRQEKLVKSPPTEVHSDPSRSSGREGGANIDFGQPTVVGTMMDTSRLAGSPAPNPDEISLLIGTHLRLHDHWGSEAPQGNTARHRPTSAAQSGPKPSPPTEMLVPGAPEVVASACPRVLQPPRLHRRVLVPVLPRGGTSGSVPCKAGGCSVPPANLRTKQLPPPSRGLPCFIAGPPGCSSLPQPRTAPGLWKDSGSTNATATDLRLEEEHDPRETRVLSTPGLSRLPKPKIN